MKNKVIMLACISGALAVGIGAFGAHGLEPHRTKELMNIFKTGHLYHALHTLALLAVGMLMPEGAKEKMLNLASILFIAGIILFSGSLYLLALTDLRWLGAITPLGGICFIVAWLLVALHYYRKLN